MLYLLYILSQKGAADGSLEQNRVYWRTGRDHGEKVPLYRHDLSGEFRGGGAGFYRKNKEKIVKYNGVCRKW